MIANLASEGYRIGAIKHIHHKDFKVDKEGTNTWRYAEAGAKVITAVSAEQIVVIKKAEAELSDLEQVVGLTGNGRLDIIFVEGFRLFVEKRTDVLKIITAKDEDTLKRTLEETVPPIIAVTGVIGKQKPKTKLEIPVLDIPAEGEQLIKLVKEQLKKKQAKI